MDRNRNQQNQIPRQQLRVVARGGHRRKVVSLKVNQAVTVGEALIMRGDNSRDGHPQLVIQAPDNVKIGPVEDICLTG